MAEPLLTLADVATRTGFSASHIRGLVQAGDIAHVRSNGKPTGRIRFTEEQLAGLVDKLTVTPKPQPPQRMRKRRR